MEQESSRHEHDPEHRARQVDVMPGASRFAPTHPRKELKGFADVRQNDHDETSCTEQLD